MDSYIIVCGHGRTVKVTAENNGVISEDTLRGAFQLEQDVPIGLFRNDIALKRCREDGDFVFELKEGWIGAEFELKWKEARRSRPPTPMEQDSRSNSPDWERFVILLETDQDSRSNSPDWRRFVISFLLETEQGCCVSVLAKRAAITCAHCLDDSVIVDSNIVVKPCRGNTMTNFPNGETSTTLKVAYIDKYTDFALLLSKIDLCDEPPFPVDAVFGETYVLLGLSAEDRQYTKLENMKIKMVNGPLCVKKGVVSSKVLDSYNKHMGDSGMKKGDSGGGLYTLCGHFIGIAVEFDRSEKNGISMCYFNPVTGMLGIIQGQGYALFDLNNYEVNDYPEKNTSLPKDRIH